MFRRVNFRVIKRSFSTPSMEHAKNDLKNLKNDAKNMYNEAVADPAKSSTMKTAGIALLAFGGIYIIGRLVGVSHLS
jgi:hypothetical protein